MSALSAFLDLFGFLSNPWARSVSILLTGVLFAFLTDLGVRRGALRIARRTANDIDDRLVMILHLPMSASVGMLGVWYSVVSLRPADEVLYATRVLLVSVLVLLWAFAGVRVSRIILDFLAANQRRYAIIHPRTLPIFDMLFKVVIILAAVYFLLLAWKIDVTGWIASAGVAGVVLGFAAQDTLGNLFAGFAIIADAPYKLGDYLVLDNGTRGRVIRIGLRSTRVLTQDEIEIVVPNATMANSVIINESGGPYEKERIRVAVGVGYGSDVEQVRRVLESCAGASPDVVLDEPARDPVARFVAFGASSLDFELHLWIRLPESRTAVLDQVNTAIYQQLNEAGIEIPFPKQDVYLYPRK